MNKENQTVLKKETEEATLINTANQPRLIKRALRRIQLEQVHSRGELTTWMKC